MAAESEKELSKCVSTTNELTAMEPWWNEAPAQWLSPIELKTAYASVFESAASVRPRISTSSARYVAQVFRNNCNSYLNGVDGRPGLWRSQTTRAENVTWKDGSRPQFRQYKVLFSRDGWLDMPLNWLLGRTGAQNTCVSTIWREVIVDNRIQICITTEAPWNAHVAPIYVKARVRTNSDYFDTLSLDLMVLSAAYQEHKSALQSAGETALEITMIQSYIVPYLTFIFSRGVNAIASEYKLS